MLPRFEVIARHRPVAIVGSPFVQEECDPTTGTRSGTAATPFLAPYAAIEVALASGAGTTTLALTAADGSTLSVSLVEGSVSLSVAVGGSGSRHRSRRHGRVRAAPTRFALTLTGTHLAALTFENDAWLVRGRVDVAGLLDTRDPAWLGGLTSSWVSTGSTGPVGAVTGWSAGAFGQLGLRDIRLVSHADGSPYRDEGAVLFTATSAGPGFFDTGHTSLWRLDGTRLTHCSDLFFERPDRTGSFGDHATHLVRDGERWLVATSTWADFPGAKAQRRDATVQISLAESTDDLLRGQHVLATRFLALPTDGPSVGVWDPHLVRTATGQWLVGYVSARKFFDFHPVLASGPSLDELTLRGAATDRRATEGTTIVRIGDDWRVLASDGRDSSRATRGRFPVFDLELREVGALEAPYPTNIPWPTVIAPDESRPDDEWSLVTFDGTPAGGRLAGYGTHGDVVVMRAR
ncbi:MULTISPECIES: hypothetical protein [unclassified Nocardioides]|uniref:hypothetical protein n=1 Tax=unclassified Nocardioides TaxID=2615069 RepID=UPI0007020795|nr:MULTISPECIES: hypothetical protein [unclassified Nocardioides]KRA38613.1 hypothetical protein ASD81_08390 [Nocardioides sp. Root614]KRA92573.1 hypothetical protein ASD84_08655 [Nocardioides sp. Root682]